MKGGRAKMGSHTTRRKLSPGIEVDFANCSSSASSFIGSAGIYTNRSAEVKGIGKSLNDGFEFTPAHMIHERVCGDSGE
jgi:hypothetical protein